MCLLKRDITHVEMVYLRLPLSLCALPKKHSYLITYGYILSGSFCSTAQKVLADQVLFGQTISYKSLASLCGNEQACRAVGMAMKNNPISIIVPCHRVIKHTGNVGNYHGGQKNKVKHWLLKHEHAI
jgi:methylated-DNA-[protein]-cysteine S-methyltransferase